MPFEPKRILTTLARHGVDVIVVGGIGGVLQGSPLLTDDVDVVPLLKRPNLDALAAALNELNAALMSAEAPGGSIRIDWNGKDLQRWIVDFRFINLATDYGQLDLIHRPGGTDGYADLAPAAIAVEIDGMELKVAALEDIIRSKEAVGRDRDLQQVPTLRTLLEATRRRG
ncbi:MAG TPA: hypothetical protein VHN37_02370 [Actinomycetota bacterium]|nr:hypothetical protein [Actinomycetota bacterium]